MFHQNELFLLGEKYILLAFYLLEREEQYVQTKNEEICRLMPAKSRH